MKPRIILLSIVFTTLFSCHKSKTTAPTMIASTASVTPNNYSFKIGLTNYSTNDLYGQTFDYPTDTLLFINAGSASDTITGGFTLKLKSLGTFTHDSTSTSAINHFVINFGNPSSPTSSFTSKSGTITVTSFDKINMLYAGTFSGIMYLTSNPSYTLPLTSGSFYLKN